MQDEEDGQGSRPDAVTEIVLREAADPRWSTSSRPLPATVAMLDDEDAALTLALAAKGISPRTWCDDLRDELAVPAAHRCATQMRGAGRRADGAVAAP